MNDFNIKLDSETVCNITEQYLTHILDSGSLPENREIEFMLACQEILHYIMIPSEWEKRFGTDYMGYINET